MEMFLKSSYKLMFKFEVYFLGRAGTINRNIDYRSIYKRKLMDMKIKKLVTFYGVLFIYSIKIKV